MFVYVIYIQYMMHLLKTWNNSAKILSRNPEHPNSHLCSGKLGIFVITFAEIIKWFCQSTIMQPPASI